MVAIEHLEELQLICQGAKEMSEGGLAYIHLPSLKLPEGCSPAEVEALLCLSSHSGYSTRLFLRERVAGRGNNWTTHCVLGRSWHTWSWNHIPSSLRPMQILAEHLRGLG